MQRLARTAIWGVLLLSLGCSRLQKSSVSGVVSFKGQPLPGGTVTFIDADDQKKHSAIAKDGRYVVEGLVRGTARITVVSHPRIPAGFNKSRPAIEGKQIVIPNRYADSETSQLSFRARGGKETHDIDLAP